MALIIGTNFGDSIQASDTSTEIRGLDGNDTILGGAGKDTLAGNLGDDSIYAAKTPETASGSDSVLGGQGDDTLVGSLYGFGGDSLGGNKGNDLILASSNGGSLIFGGQGNDTVYGSITGSNVVNGDLGNDLLIAGKGGDRLLGGDGSDTLVGGNGTDNLFGSDGADTFQFFSQSIVTLPFLTPEQNIRTEGGFGGSDTIFDFGAGDTIQISQLDRNAMVSVADNAAGAAVITISGSASNGQSAVQTITVANTNTTALLAPGSQLLSVNGAFITTASPGVQNTGRTSTYTVGDAPGNIAGQNITGSQIADEISPNSPTPGFQTTVSDDTVNGGSGDDTIDGGLGNDLLSGGNGNDTIIGGSGADTLTGGDGLDVFLFRNPSEGVDTIVDFTANPLAGTPPLSDLIDIVGGAFNIGANNTLITPGVLGVAIPLGADGQYAAFTQDPGQFGAQDFAKVYSTTRGTFYYDTTGSGLYFDSDGTATSDTFHLLAIVPFAKNIPIPAVAPAIRVI